MALEDNDERNLQLRLTMAATRLQAGFRALKARKYVSEERDEAARLAWISYYVENGQVRYSLQPPASAAIHAHPLHVC